MGSGRRLKCVECGETFNLRLGIGFFQPAMDDEATKDALAGKYGEEWQTLLKENENRYVTTEFEFFYCEHCHIFETVPNLSIYERTKDGDCKIVKEFVHKCPKCGAAMKIKDKDEIENLDLRCSKCGGDLTFTEDRIMWD